METTKISPPSKRHPDEKPPLIVGIGASAGGLEALERLFECMPADTGMVFVVIQHLSPDFKSLTDTLLARRTAIPIRQAENDMPVEPNVCYLLPPRKDMILSNGHLLLTDKDPATAVALPIDRFFRSLAQDAAERSVAVVLSGTGSDGSRGIRDVDAASGLVIAQSPETAKFDGMPQSAIATGVVDYSIPPEDIPATLLRHAQNPHERETLANLPTQPPLSGLDAIFQLLRNAYGIDFSVYKPETVTRRIGRRLEMLRITGVDEYVDRLMSEPEELNQLYKDLLIGVTKFFRDAEAFEQLRKDWLARYLPTMDQDAEFRVWVTGCATGEEVYSLAIVIREALEALGRDIDVKIFATDVHRKSLDVAAAGIYSDEALAGVSPTRLAKFFTPRANGFQVSPELRKQVVFAQHNVLRDAPFTKLDLVVCRNLLIYFLPIAQKKVLSLFHFGLKTGGALFLGPSEGPGDLADEFDVISARWKLYSKRRDIRLTTDIRATHLPTIGLAPIATTPVSITATTESPNVAVLNMLLDECMTPGLLVNERRQIVRTFAGGSRYLDQKDGWFTADVLEVVRPELRPVLAGALPRAFVETAAVTFKGLSVALPDGNRSVDLRVKPLRNRRSSEAYAIVLLIESDAPAARPASREMDLDEAASEHILALEAELQSVKESLQATIEELETSNEELQATNEELIASNEELQSTNEELHSVNEELYTVNGEFQKKIEELTELSSDMENLLDSTEVHTIFLDRELRVRKFTPKVTTAFHLLPQDIGRKIEHFAHSIDHLSLVDDLKTALTGRTIELPVQDRKGTWFLLRILPYRSGASIDGVVLTLVDIDRLKRAETAARIKDEQLAGILRNSPNWVFIKDIHGRYLLADEAFKRLVGRDPIGKNAFDLFPAHVAEVLVAQDQEVLQSESAVEKEIVIPHSDGPHTYLSIMFPIRDENGALSALGGIRTDVTALKRAEAEAREAVAQRDRFLATLSHELRNPLAAILNSTRIIDRTGQITSDVAEWFRIIERRARHMARLLDDLLDVARVTQGKIEIRREPFDLTRTVSDVLEEVRPVFDERRVRLVVETPEHPLPLTGDPGRLQQVQVNLLKNAAKYTPEGGTVWYSLQANGRDAIVRVNDTGAGMTADVLQRIFEPFVQADETLDRSDGGMGIGLTLVRAIVEMHGGQVEAQSDGPGRGSLFEVRLPMQPTSLIAPSGPMDNGKDKVAIDILLVEDDPDIRTSLQAMLTLDGHQVRSVASGPDALAAITERLPDVAILDIGLPKMNGYELARLIKADHPDLPLIAMTGYGQPLDQMAANDSGFDHHLTKPPDLKSLDLVLRLVSPVKQS